MKKFSKIFLLLLIALTLSSILAVTVFAEEGANEEATVPEGSAIEYTDAEGTVTYHAANDFTTLCAKGGKIKLLGDIDTDIVKITIASNLTIDLNGYDIRRVYECGIKYRATDNGDGTYTYKTGLANEIERVGVSTPTSDSKENQAGNSGINFFSVNKGISLNITSTREGSEIFVVVLNTNTWYNDSDEKLDHSVSTFRTSNLVYLAGGSGVTTSFDMSNVTVYSSMLVSQTGTSGTYKVTIDNINHFAMGTTAGDNNVYYYTNTFSFVNKGYVYCNVSNSILYNKVSNSLVRSYSGSNTTTKLFITFTNCDIIKDNDSYTTGISNGLATDMTYKAQILFNNCRILDTSSSGAYVGPGTLALRMDYDKNDTVCPPAIEGYELCTIPNRQIKYTVPNVTNFLFDSGAETPTPSFSYATKSLTLSYNTYVSKPVTVNWSHNGEIVKTETLYPGVDTFTAPVIDNYYDESDDYRNISYQWADAAEDGNAIPEVPGWEDSYTYYAVTEINGVKNYTAGLKGAMLNMTYMAHFQYNFYLPITEGVEITKVAVGSDTKSAGKNVWISDGEYYRYTLGYPTSTGALDYTTVTVKYTVDGQSFTANCKFNVLTYAELAYVDEKTTDVEKEALGCLVRYVHESYKFKATGNTLPEATEKIFQDYYTNYHKPADYVTEYPADELHTVNEDLLEDYIESIHFTVIGSKVTFAVTLTDEALAQGCRILFGNVGYKDSISSNGKIYYTDNRGLYSHLMHPSYLITVTDKNYTTLKVDTDGNGTAETALTTKYSMATYIKSMEEAGNDVSLAKSLYAFGKATLAVRDQIYN